MGCLVLGIASIAHLETHRRLIKHYAERYTSKCWAVVYQADVRARLELTERLRRIGEEEHARLGEASEYDTTRPWEYVWKRIQQHSFWRKEVEERRCLLILS